MTTADWDEVKRLAADFQKAQLSNALQKLSERNCVEIIMKLTEDKLLSVIFTNDGKEYVTPQHLAQEIKDELFVHGGRIDLAQLAKILNVDLSQISKASSEIEKHNRGIKILLGQLIDKTYVHKISEEINDKLNQNGFINVVDLTLLYDLPADFIQSTIEKELGKTIFGKQDSQDPKIIYNQEYIARNEAKIRGALSALTRPTPISVILGQCAVPERIFFSILENLQDKKQIPGVVSGKQSNNSIYVPTIYSKGQSDWVDSFYRQNGYLEYDAMSRLGISDPKSFVKRHFPNENLIYLDSVAVGSIIIDQVNANIEEVVATGSFTDIYTLLPSVFSSCDAEILLKESSSRMKSFIHIFSSSMIVSDAYLQTIQKNLESLCHNKAKEAVDSGKWLQSVVENKIKSKAMDIIDTKADRKSERRKKAAGGKAGGGSQGRETKTKSTKKKYQQNKHQDSESDEENSEKISSKLDLINIDDLKMELSKDESLSDMEELIDELAIHFLKGVNKTAASIAEQLSQKHKTTNLSEVEEKLNSFVTTIRVYDKGIKCLEKSIQEPMVKYLLKTLGVDFVTEIFKLSAQQNVIQCPPNLSTEVRHKMLLELPKDVREPLSELHKVVSGNSLENFMNAVEPAMAACCLVLKKYDKKKDRAIVVGIREAMLEQLNCTKDPALALHLTTAILYIAITQNALHMSGRHVHTILTFLRPLLVEATGVTLFKYHDLVLQFLSTSDQNVKKSLQNELEENLVQIQIIANDYKKQMKDNKVQDS